MVDYVEIDIARTTRGVTIWLVDSGRGPPARLTGGQIHLRLVEKPTIT